MGKGSRVGILGKESGELMDDMDGVCWDGNDCEMWNWDLVESGF